MKRDRWWTDRFRWNRFKTKSTDTIDICVNDYLYAFLSSWYLSSLFVVVVVVVCQLKRPTTALHAMDNIILHTKKQRCPSVTFQLERTCLLFQGEMFFVFSSARAQFPQMEFCFVRSSGLSWQKENISNISKHPKNNRIRFLPCLWCVRCDDGITPTKGKKPKIK